MEEVQVILIHVRDLMFSTRIVEAAKDLKLPFKVVRNAQQLPGESGRKLIVDLNQEGALDAALAWKQAHAGPVLGFVSHVDAETIARAREGGIDQIVSRGQFVSDLPQFLHPAERPGDLPE
ncbi:MAG TPA: hypothetical protein VF669_10945 [Tepidisphaeraceae bacterium]|jgi:hypothetical protein